MKVQQLFLRNVRSIKSLDLDFRDPVTGKPMSRIVLAGANGSGKTTILDCIIGLIGSLTLSDFQPPYLQSDSGVYLTLEPPREVTQDVWAIALNMGRSIEENYRLKGAYLEWQNLKDGDWYEVDIGFAIRELLRGTEERERQFTQKASLLFLPDNRRLLPTESSGPITPEEENLWISRHTPTDQWKGSVESYLVWQNYLDLEDRDKGIKADRFQRITSVVNQILDQKHISGVERGRVVVEVSGQTKHGLDDLSSGERQIVLLLVEITRRIKPGSVILIDEPEISLHPAWQRGLVVALDKIIEQYDAQVIMATHSPEIAGMVQPHEVLFLSDLGVPPGEWKPEREVLA